LVSLQELDGTSRSGHEKILRGAVVTAGASRDGKKYPRILIDISKTSLKISSSHCCYENTMVELEEKLSGFLCKS
jgi:hypothetical protein